MNGILITGGAGFIGSEVVRKFLSTGMDVVVYDNFSYGKREFLPASNRLAVVEGETKNITILIQQSQ